ncbi:Zn-ribbon domain-containing protein [Halococcus dombrowskii]|uniref:Zn-ribbon domain-containing protein n=1 Tax=Halococcus dombrowskii TaxID=179637 RepID=A0AAV3SKS5_HALDO|nr:Zn-ribbon domain-containing protein [Halococcus dombrowskii]UOO95528.1 Zn-ribbon domain-containing protein [Halococcus dombrowskii]
MPHQCTECGHTFPDGSKEMLSGCPDCGGNKFKFEPAADAREASAAQSANESTDAAATEHAPDDPAAAQPPPAADGPGDASSDGPPAVDSDTPAAVETEDGAQADARRDVASPDDLAAGAGPGTDDIAASDDSATLSAGETDPSADPTDPADDSDVSDADGADDAEMAALRRELDDQFESIKILEPGQYELNLMELYNREEFIIALQEDGQYVIDVPGSWHGE